jgi:transcriptional regulator with XRE-family HTH domain
MNAITKFRDAKGLTQEQVALLLGTTKATISRWESDKRRPDPAMAIAIETKLGIPRHELRPDLFQQSNNKNSSRKKSKAKSKSIMGILKGMVTFPPDFNPEEPFWELHKEWDDFEIGGMEDKK